MKDKELNKKQQEEQNRWKNLNEFNAITKKVKPENQNQYHNAGKEGLGSSNQMN